MTFEIKFDYRFDTKGFYTSEKRAILEAAAELWSSYIRDDFTAIPAGETIRVPVDTIELRDNGYVTQTTFEEVTLTEDIDDVIIFMSSVALPNEQKTLGEGAFYGEYIIGSDRETRLTGNDFEPWLGTIVFNSSAEEDFYFDSTLNTDDDVPNNKTDFLTLAAHEIGHILGVGTAPAFEALTKNGAFRGEKTVALNDGEPVPIEEDGTHIEEDFNLNSDSEALLDPSLTDGDRILPDAIELAMLADIGYEIQGLDRTTVHRFFQFEKGFHFYTANDVERDNVRARSESGELQYNYEGGAYEVLASNRDIITGEIIEDAKPVYRFFNRETGAHLYTMDKNEKNYIIKNLSNYNFENIGYYAFESEPENIDTVPLYRMLNTQTGAHLFTSDRNEFEIVDATLPQFEVEGNGGIAFYVFE